MNNYRYSFILIAVILLFPTIQVVYAQESTDAQNPLEKLLDEYIRKKNVDKIKEMRQLVQQNIESEPTNPHAYFISGKLEFSLGEFNNAIPLFKKGLTFDSVNSALQKGLCQSYLYAGKGAEFTEAYYQWLRIEKDETSLVQEYQLVELIMNEDDLRKFKDVAPSDKPWYLIKFWSERDPYPITPDNERLIEHMKRIRHARTAFHAQLGGFDDRGKVFIRWGTPEDKYISPVPEQMAHENESWYYPSYGLYMAFDFVNEAGYYREVNSLMDALMAGAGDPRKAQALYAERGELGGIYAMLARTDPQDFQRRIMTEIPGEKISAKQRIKPRYEIQLNMPELEFTDRISQFKGDSGKTRVELAYGLPLKQLKSTLKGDSISFIFQTDFVVIDSTFRRRMYSKNNLRFNLSPQTKYSEKNVLSEEKNELFPGEYKMSFQILETSNNKGDFRIEPLVVKNFNSNDLMISDLKFSEKIESMGVDSLTGRERLSALPYPLSFISQKQPIYLYFEIYNLLLEPGKGSKYNISLSVARRQKKGDFITQPLQTLGRIFNRGTPQTIESTYNRESGSQMSVEWIELDLSKVNTGDSRLTVTVNDLTAKKEVKNSIEFELKK